MGRGGGKRRSDHGLEAAGGFERDQRGRQLFQPFDELRNAFAITRHHKGCALRKRMHIKPVFGNIDPDINSVHHVPSLPKRASLRAAQATVRVRWNGGRAAKLRNGLDRPRMSRRPVRHRSGDVSRSGTV